MIQVVEGYKDGSASNRYTRDRKRSFDSGSTNYMIPRKRVMFER